MKGFIHQSCLEAVLNSSSDHSPETLMELRLSRGNIQAATAQPRRVVPPQRDADPNPRWPTLH